MFILIVPRGGASVLTMIILIPMLVIGGIAAPAWVGYMIYKGLTTERSYQAHYGDTWKEHFLEEQRVSVEKTNENMIVGAGGLIVIGGTLYAIYRQVTPKRIGAPRKSRRRRGRRHG